MQIRAPCTHDEELPTGTSVVSCMRNISHTACEAVIHFAGLCIMHETSFELVAKFRRLDSLTRPTSLLEALLRLQKRQQRRLPR